MQSKSANANLEAAEKMLIRAQQELERVENLPEEPEGDESLIWFQKVHHGIRYTYAAVKVPNYESSSWYLTGRNSSGPYRWDELLNFIASGQKVMPEVWLASEMIQLI